MNKSAASVDDTHPKIWLQILYLGRKGENLVKYCIKKIHGQLKEPINFVVYSNKNVSYFLSNKDKYPDLSQRNLVYEISCPGCGSKYIGNTDLCLSKRRTEHSTQLKFRSVAEHFLRCEHTQHLVNLNQIFDRLHDTSSVSNNCNIRNLVFNNFKIIHSCKYYSSNVLLLLEALYTKFNSSELNVRHKVSKELTLFS